MYEITKKFGSVVPLPLYVVSVACFLQKAILHMLNLAVVGNTEWAYLRGQLGFGYIADCL